VRRQHAAVDEHRARESHAAVPDAMSGRQTAELDRQGVPIVMEQEPGSSGVIVRDHLLRLLAGWPFYSHRSTGSKSDRAMPLAALVEGGAVKLVRGPWNAAFLDEAEVFPFAAHDDQIDSASLALSHLAWMGADDGVPEVLVPGKSYGDDYHGFTGSALGLGGGEWPGTSSHTRRHVAPRSPCRGRVAGQSFTFRRPSGETRAAACSG
jgi:predicted phage terminase large subunit-like protein